MKDMLPDSGDSLARSITEPERMRIFDRLNPSRNSQRVKGNKGERGEICSLLAHVVSPTNYIEESNGKLVRQELWNTKVSNLSGEIFLDTTHNGIVAVYNPNHGRKRNIAVPVAEIDTLARRLTPAPSTYHCDYSITVEAGYRLNTNAKMGKGNAFAIANANRTIALASRDGDLYDPFIYLLAEEMGIEVSTLEELYKSTVFIANRLGSWSYQNGFTTDTSRIADHFSSYNFSHPSGFSSLTFALSNDTALEAIIQGLITSRPSTNKSGKILSKGKDYCSFVIRRGKASLWNQIEHSMLSLPLANA